LGTKGREKRSYKKEKKLNKSNQLTTNRVGGHRNRGVQLTQQERYLLVKEEKGKPGKPKHTKNLPLTEKTIKGGGAETRKVSGHKRKALTKKRREKHSKNGEKVGGSLVKGQHDPTTSETSPGSCTRGKTSCQEKKPLLSTENGGRRKPWSYLEKIRKI